MKVILIFNGLGNQMSQFAYYLAQKQRHRDVYYIYQPPTVCEDHNGYELDKVFSIPKEKFYSTPIRWLYNLYKHKPKLRKIVGSFVWIYEEKTNYDFDPEVFQKTHKICFFFGGWHSEKYFIDIKNIILNKFKFNQKKLNSNSISWAQIICENVNSVAVHVRRGDFVNHWMWKDIANADYYDRAFHFIDNKISNAVYFVFSNDIDWCKTHFLNKSLYYVDCNSGGDSWQDLYLMTLCHHHINANSTFSWWGAWLSNFDDSIIIVPSKFRNDIDSKDIYPDTWIKL